MIEAGSRWKSFRNQMPVAKKWAYFDHAAVGPLPQSAVDRIEEYTRQISTAGDTDWLSWHTEVEATRKLAARLINAAADEVALMPSTTAGIGIVAEGYPWEPGDNVVTFENEFPSNLLPWWNLATRGVETRIAPVVDGRIDIDQLADLIDGRTRIVAASWIGYATGFRIDVDQLVQVAHDRGALVMLDAIQGLGVFPLDVARSKVDFVAADGHKWMLGPEGAGLLYLRREHLGLLRPLGVGWHSARRPFDFHQESLDLREDAARYEGGTQNMVGFMALGASLGTLEGCGLAATTSPIADRVLEISDHACERIESVGGRLCYARVQGHRSGIVNFELPQHRPDDIRRACLASQVVVSCRGRGVRVSLHAYNDENDVDRLISALP